VGGRHRHYTFTLAHLHTVFSSCRDREREWESDTGITLSHLHTCTLFLLSCRDRERGWEGDTGITLSHLHTCTLFFRRAGIGSVSGSVTQTTGRVALGVEGEESGIPRLSGSECFTLHCVCVRVCVCVCVCVRACVRVCVCVCV